MWVFLKLGIEIMLKILDCLIILGVVGDSVMGKIIFFVGVVKILGEDCCMVICIDDYYVFDCVEWVKNGVLVLDFKGNYIDIFG